MAQDSESRTAEIARFKILHVHGEYFSEGGAETYLRALVNAQRDRGFRVGLLYNSESPCETPGTSDVIFCSPSFGLRSGLRVRRKFLYQIRAWQPDLIHLHVTQYRMSPLLVRALVRHAPTVITIHDTLFLCLKGLEGRDLQASPRILPGARAPCLEKVGAACFSSGCVKQLASSDGWGSTIHRTLNALYRVRAYRHIDRFLVNSEFSRQELLRNNFPEDRVTLFPIASDLPATWLTSAHEAPEVGGDPPEILYVGKMLQAKGVMLLLEALSRLSALRWSATLAGSGPEEDGIRAFIQAKNLSGRVNLVGPCERQALTNLYRKARMVVFPSLWPESFGLVGIEAMHHGRPVIGFKSGAISEWLKDGQTGYLVPWGDVSMLSQRIARLLEEPELARSMGHTALTQAKHFLSFAEHADRLYGVYEQVLTARGQSKSRLSPGRPHA